MLDRYRLAAELREFLLDRGVTFDDAALDDLVDLFIARCHEMYGDPADHKKPT